MKHLLFDPQPGQTLEAELARILPPVVGRPVTDGEVARLIHQGSVFRDKARWRHWGVPDTGSPFEVFWPDLPVEEYILDPKRIVWQDEHLLVIDKPAGINTAPSPFSDRDCLTWGVQIYLDNGFEVHAVHRLDRDTQGLIFFAKHKEAERALHALFRTRSIRKVYQALTPSRGEAAPRVFRWRDVLEFRGKAQSAATTALWTGQDDRGRDVWTVLPHTGRTHQIRRHFARYWVPLWGDAAYAPGQYSGEGLGLACVAYRCRHPITGALLQVSRPGFA